VLPDLPAQINQRRNHANCAEQFRQQPDIGPSHDSSKLSSADLPVSQFWMGGEDQEKYVACRDSMTSPVSGSQSVFQLVIDTFSGNSSVNDMPGPLAVENSSLGAAPKEISLQEFLETTPPSQMRKVSGYGRSLYEGWGFSTPDIQLFCSEETCQRIQFFCSIDQGDVRILGRRDVFLHYLCRNCCRTEKTFAIHVQDKPSTTGRLIKIGEWPAFGPPLPARLQRLVQPDRGFLVKGFRSENAGLGIGAFAYYRRVVEDEKDRLIDEIVKVCKKIPGADQLIPGLENAKKQIQFTKAVEEIADAIPDVLRIDGRNPLTLLHHALSKSLHSESDEECLDAAHAIRVLLAEFAERMSQVLKEDAEVSKAVGKLLAGRSTTARTGKTSS
jgi:hypothetical protein